MKNPRARCKRCGKLAPFMAQGLCKKCQTAELVYDELYSAFQESKLPSISGVFHSFHTT